MFSLRSDIKDIERAAQWVAREVLAKWGLPPTFPGFEDLLQEARIALACTEGGDPFKAAIAAATKALRSEIKHSERAVVRAMTAPRRSRWECGRLTPGARVAIAQASLNDWEAVEAALLESRKTRRGRRYVREFGRQILECTALGLSSRLAAQELGIDRSGIDRLIRDVEKIVTKESRK